jgi:hypothetical protein
LQVADRAAARRQRRQDERGERGDVSEELKKSPNKLPGHLIGKVRDMMIPDMMTEVEEEVKGKSSAKTGFPGTYWRAGGRRNGLAFTAAVANEDAVGKKGKVVATVSDIRSEMWKGAWVDARAGLLVKTFSYYTTRWWRTILLDDSPHKDYSRTLICPMGAELAAVEGIVGWNRWESPGELRPGQLHPETDESAQRRGGGDAGDWQQSSHTQKYNQAVQASLLNASRRACRVKRNTILQRHDVSMKSCIDRTAKESEVVNAKL